MKLMLDYDGCLHPAFIALENNHPVLKGEGRLFMWAPHLIEALAPYPDVKIVLSTSWVHVIGFERARNYLPEALRKRVIGATWFAAMDSSPYASQTSALHGWSHMTRYEQISLYLRRAEIEHWLAIDDDHIGWKPEERNRLIQTDPELGLSEIEVFERLKKALAELTQGAPKNGIKP